MDGAQKARDQGFVLQLPELSDSEKQVFSSREEFANAVPKSRVMQGGEDSDVHDTNLRKVQDMVCSFPNLIVKLAYPVRIIDNDGDYQQSGEQRQEVPLNYNRTEAVSLISLSVALLTEYTRSGQSRNFFRRSESSMQAIIVLAMSLRALVLKSTNVDLSPFENFVLGNVYFDEADVPREFKGISTILAFQKEESNVSRLKKKLTISKKTYLEEEAMKNEQELEEENCVSKEDPGMNPFVLVYQRNPLE